MYMFLFWSVNVIYSNLTWNTLKTLIGKMVSLFVCLFVFFFGNYPTFILDQKLFLSIFL